jgi:putative membrane protein insertion efficiency factor
VSPLAHLLRGLVHVYRWTLSPILGANCRFEPSCSRYALDAVATHGALRGGVMAGWRILRCNPWGGMGWDPVPPRHGPGCACDHPPGATSRRSPL